MLRLRSQPLPTAGGVPYECASAGDAERRLQMRWVESGGPPVVAPARRGFGSMMIERALSSELQGCVDLEFASDGLVCTIDAPLPDPASS